MTTLTKAWLKGGCVCSCASAPASLLLPYLWRIESTRRCRYFADESVREDNRRGIRVKKLVVSHDRSKILPFTDRKNGPDQRLLGRNDKF